MKKPQPVPAAEVVGFDGEIVELHCKGPLEVGWQQVRLTHAELQLDRECKVSVDQAFPEKELYWVSLPADSMLNEELKSLIPEDVPSAENAEPAWEEKRRSPRLVRSIGIMSPVIPGFRTVSYDFNRFGVRIRLREAVPLGPLKLRLDLDDHRLDPIDATGTVVWCAESPEKGFWAGISLEPLPEKAAEIIDSFVAEVNSYEQGVLTRGYQND